MRSGQGRGRRIIPRNDTDTKTYDSGFDTADSQNRRTSTANTNTSSADRRVPLGINPQPSNSTNIQNNSNNEQTTPINRMEYEHKMPKCGDQVCLRNILAGFLSMFRELNRILSDVFLT